ncbi:MAG TPA: zf-HC2 domain-containing protein [Caulobacteraceae bacterium]|nr:zf-HC2 domain-containing protein [Caulobacteraceae bacterium]
MTACPDWQHRLQGLIDDELDAAHAAEVEAHVTTCAGCAQARDDALALRRRLGGEGVRARAPDRLLARLDAAIGAATTTVPVRRSTAVGRFERAFWAFGGAGAAIAACAVLAVMAVPALQTADLEHQLVASHVRSQLAGHLIDVATSDQHVVKPWFGGKIDFSPPVVDLADQGFPIVGGRLDYIGGRTVAAVVYRRGRHVINLFAWPDRKALGPDEAKLGDGYTLLHWTKGGMTFWAVSDVAETDLKTFRQLAEDRSPA